jgi:hypothetical protein
LALDEQEISVGEQESFAGESGEQARAELTRLALLHGRLLLAEPQRCEGMLRDRCPESRRAVFLLSAALKEGVASLLVESLNARDEALGAATAARLRENLGLSEPAARWAVESWIAAARVLKSAPYRPLRATSSYLPLPNAAGEEADRPAVDWMWLCLSATAILSAAVALLASAYFALHHYWNSFQSWLIQTAQFALALVAPATLLWLAARGLKSRPAPDHRLLDVNRTAAALLVEVLVLLALPLVPPVSLAFWSASGHGNCITAARRMTSRFISGGCSSL